MGLHYQDHPTTAQPQPLPEWHTLYNRCSSTDPVEAGEGYQQLWKRLLPHAQHYLYSKLGLQVEAQDCAQEAVVDILKRMTTNRGPTGQAQSFKPWCITIVRRKVFDLLRRPAYQAKEICCWKMSESEDETIADGLDLEEAVVNRLSLTTLFQDALNHPALTPLQRQVLWLHCVEELDYAEIAQRLHKNITTIRVNRHRAIVALQKDAAFMARIGGTLDVHRPSRQQDMGRQGIDW